MDTSTELLTGLAADIYRQVSGDERSWLVDSKRSTGAVLCWLEDEVPRAHQLSPMTRIGTARSAELQFDHPSVARAHAIVVQRGGRWVISVNRTTDGIWVNNEQVDEAWLEPGDKIRIGCYQLYFLIVGD